VSLDDVQVLTGPPLTVDLAPSSDSGVTGDGVTNLGTVTVIGSTLPGQVVLMDLDGDGFDDGTVTASAVGGFQFDGVILREGVNRIRFEATSGEGTTTLERMFVLDQTAPAIVGADINEGLAQRSMVTSIRIRFSEDVRASLSAEDLILRNLTTGSTVASEWIRISYSGDNRLTITFPGLEGGSLPDGNYVATFSALGITDPAGNQLDADGDGQGGDGLVLDFFRYYGDLDGDRDVDFADMFWFQRTYRQTDTSADYNRALDFNADGRVEDSVDLVAYRRNYLTTLALPVPEPSSPADPTPTPSPRVAPTPTQSSVPWFLLVRGPRVSFAIPDGTMELPMAPEPAGATAFEWLPFTGTEEEEEEEALELEVGQEPASEPRLLGRGQSGLSPVSPRDSIQRATANLADSATASAPSRVRIQAR
jgi:hypothetical protein